MSKTASVALWINLMGSTAKSAPRKSVGETLCCNSSNAYEDIENDFSISKTVKRCATSISVYKHWSDSIAEPRILNRRSSGKESTTMKAMASVQYSHRSSKS